MPGKVWLMPSKRWSSLADFGPKSIENGPDLADAAPIWPSLVKVVPIWALNWVESDRCTQFRPNLGDVWPDVCKHRPAFQECAQPSLPNAH